MTRLICLRVSRTSGQRRRSTSVSAPAPLSGRGSLGSVPTGSASVRSGVASGVGGSATGAGVGVGSTSGVGAARPGSTIAGHAASGAGDGRAATGVGVVLDVGCDGGVAVGAGVETVDSAVGTAGADSVAASSAGRSVVPSAARTAAAPRPPAPDAGPPVAGPPVAPWSAGTTVGPLATPAPGSEPVATAADRPPRSNRSSRAANPATPSSADGSSSRATNSSRCSRGEVAPVISRRASLTRSAARESSAAPRCPAWMRIAASWSVGSSRKTAPAASPEAEMTIRSRMRSRRSSTNRRGSWPVLMTRSTTRNALAPSPAVTAPTRSSSRDTCV